MLTLLQQFLSIILLAATALAAPQFEKRQDSSPTCGDTTYSSSQVNNALNAGCDDLSSGDAPGGYPHQYNNYEGFDFPVSGPWYEFPLVQGTYTGGSPGADRVVFNDNCEYAGAITHTGASGNNFVGCSGTS